NYENAISFGDYPTAGVIAVASVWYNPATKTIVEFDIMFDTDWTWGDADGNPDVMDLQNIAVHELGHGVGLADVYDTECSAVTMYGYSADGETQKRDLADPDITGIQELYGGLNY
ncbi:MAG: matrixin family metalloprotease, partial [Dehalococcoidia bacterium]